MSFNSGSTVHVIAYEFSIHGLKTEVHTEIRAFGYDYWFEINGAKKIKSRNKEKEPYDGSKYTMTQFIGQFSLHLLAQEHSL